MRIHRESADEGERGHHIVTTVGGYLSGMACLIATGRCNATERTAIIGRYLDCQSAHAAWFADEPSS